MRPEQKSSLDRVKEMGVHAASPTDLVALAFARREEDVSLAEHAARDFVLRAGSLKSLTDLTPDRLRDAFGYDGFEAWRALALVELGRRAGAAGKGEPVEISSPRMVAGLLSHLRDEKREHVVALLLDAKMNVLRIATIHIGTLTMSVVGPREVFREAIREGASSIIVAHNHPSGDPNPSPEDLEVTERLVEVGRMLDIPVLDHVIIGDRREVSFKERGLIE